MRSCLEDDSRVSCISIKKYSTFYIARLLAEGGEKDLGQIQHYTSEYR